MLVNNPYRSGLGLLLDPPSSATSTTLSPRTSTWARCRVRGRARAGLRIFGVVVSAASTSNKFMCRSNAFKCPTTTPLMELMRRSVTRTLTLSRNALHNNEWGPSLNVSVTCDSKATPRFVEVADGSLTTWCAPCFTRVS